MFNYLLYKFRHGYISRYVDLFSLVLLIFLGKTRFRRTFSLNFSPLGTPGVFWGWVAGFYVRRGPGFITTFVLQ